MPHRLRLVGSQPWRPVTVSLKIRQISAFSSPSLLTMQAKTAQLHRLQQQRLPGAVPVVSCPKQLVQCQASRRDLLQTTYSAATLLLAGQVLPALADVEQDVQALQAVAAVADAEVASSSASTSAAVAGGKQVCARRNCHHSILQGYRPMSDLASALQWGNCRRVQS